MKIKTKANVFMSAAYDPRQVTRELAARDEVGLSRLAFWPWGEMAGWAKLGTAEIEMELDDRAATQEVVATLEDKLRSEQADSQRRQAILKDQINRLLAIEYDAPKVEPAAPSITMIDDDIPF